MRSGAFGWGGGLLLAATMISFTRGAQAHLVTTGLGPVYNSIAHFALSLEDFVAVGGLALLAGLRGPTHGRWSLFIIPFFWFLSAAVPGHTFKVHVTALIPAAALLIVGALVAVDTRLPVSGVTVLAAIVGLIHGCSNGIWLPGDRAGLLMLAGIVAAVFTFLALLVGLVLPLRSQFARLAVRICGSSVAAAGLLLLIRSIPGAGSIHT